MKPKPISMMVQFWVSDAAKPILTPADKKDIGNATVMILHKAKLKPGQTIAEPVKVTIRGNGYKLGIDRDTIDKATVYVVLANEDLPPVTDLSRKELKDGHYRWN